jgi:hypothetical protein
MNPTNKSMLVLMVAGLISGGCIGHPTYDLPVSLGTGANPTLIWAGGPAGTLQVGEDLPDGGSNDNVFTLMGPWGNYSPLNLVPSGTTIGDVLPEGMQQYHPSTNTWDQTLEPVVLQAGHHYNILVARYHANDEGSDMAWVPYSP